MSPRSKQVQTNRVNGPDPFGSRFPPRHAPFDQGHLSRSGRLPAGS